MDITMNTLVQKEYIYSWVHLIKYYLNWNPKEQQFPALFFSPTLIDILLR